MLTSRPLGPAAHAVGTGHHPGRHRQPPAPHPPTVPHLIGRRRAAGFSARRL